MNLNDLYEMRDPRDAYERDVANSTSGFGKDSQAYQADGGANDENHALDQQSSTWYIRLNGKLIRDKSGNPYSFQNKAAANKAALTMQAKLFNKDKEFMLTTNPNDKVAEGNDRAVDAKGRTQQQWMQMVRKQFPDARIIQSKMIDGPVQAILSDGRKLGWSKADQLDTSKNFSNNEQTDNAPQRPGTLVKRLALGDVIGYMPRSAGRPTGKIVKAEVLAMGGRVGRSAVGVKLLDPEAIAANGGDPTVVISIFDVRQNPYRDESVSEDFEDLPNELLDPQTWKALDIRQKYKALVDAGLIKQDQFSSLEKQWMNDDGTNYPLDHMFAPDGLKDGSLDLNRIYRSAQADYQGRTHSSNITSQDRENELNIGSEGRAESKRKADELAEMRREKLRSERLHDEEVAFQRAETVQQRQDEMKKIADQYKHELTVIDKEHSNNMEAIKTSNKFELDKLDKEYADAQRERDFKGSETDKEYADAQREREFKSGESDKEFRDRNADRDFRAGESDKEFRDRNQDREFRSGESDKDYRDRQREREHQQSMADREREQSRPEPEEPRQRTKPQRPRPQRGDNFDQDTGEPTKPQQPSTWHTSQQLGYTPAKPNDDDITDVEPKKPPALGNSVKESLQRMTQLAGLAK